MPLNLLTETESTPTLRQALEDYLEIRTLAETTRQDMRYTITRFFADWLDVDLRSIQRLDCVRAAKQLNERGKTQSRKCFRYLGQIYRFANALYIDENESPLVKSNPVSVLAPLGLIHSVEAKTTRIQPCDVKAWFKSALRIRRDDRDLLLFLFLTGCRLKEACTLTWENVDFERRAFVLVATKNGLTVTLPIPAPLVGLLTRRHLRMSRGSGTIGGQVFSIGEPTYRTRAMSVYNSCDEIVRESGVLFSPHALRRGYISTGLSCHVPEIRIKTLTNHKQKKGSNMTARYDTPSLDELRVHADVIAAELVRQSRDVG